MTDHTDIPDQTWDRLLEAAFEARDNAYAPYSNFSVGAAMLMSSGEIYKGSNVENASIGATVCAERSAISNAVVHGERRIEALAVVTDLDRPAAPCGICRQVLSEFADELPILMATPAGEREFTTLDELLPHRFGPQDLASAK
jgi:cytidine deaminase